MTSVSLKVLKSLGITDPSSALTPPNSTNGQQGSINQATKSPRNIEVNIQFNTSNTNSPFVLFLPVGTFTFGFFLLAAGASVTCNYGRKQDITKTVSCQ